MKDLNSNSIYFDNLQAPARLESFHGGRLTSAQPDRTDLHAVLKAGLFSFDVTMTLVHNLFRDSKKHAHE